MLVRSLALTTELALAATRGTITDRGDYLVVETPDDPTYYHGNLLVLPAAPQVGEVAYWVRKFETELTAKNGAIKHQTLWWDGIFGDVGAADELGAAGFAIHVNAVMVTDHAPSPVAAPNGITIRPLDANEVLATADIAWAIADRHDDVYRRFYQRRANWHRGLAVRGAATFWGAFDGADIVGSLGLVTLGNVARYQDVQTLTAYRKRGIATALLVAAARDAFAKGVQRVVIIAEAGTGADRIYSRVGFREVEKMATALKAPT
ncbi:MAG TPA: GNAT family N-acetyltransferase [Kofleriaceae bacterium]|nr:GNAT family N-acetyltransferase [Kofleriaceae bacterium]